MVRLDETTWLKAGIEFTDGKQHLSTVATHEFSDWSLVPLTEQPDEVHLRLTRYGTAVRVEYALPSGQFQLVRLAYLPLLPSVDIGVMCCSPERADFEARFTGFTVHEALPPALHSE
jgi:regulation of enolase protein 1 (concanavalin A-like superfamily)